MIGIYKFTCIKNGKIYIGQSTNIESRYNGHKNNHLNNNLKNDYNTKFYRALRKYKFDNFEHEIIEEVSMELLDEREKYWIAYYDSFKNGYNSNSGGVGVTDRGEDHPLAKLTDAQVLEIKEYLKNNTLTQYQLQDKYKITQSEISNINNGKKWGHLGNYNYPIRKDGIMRKGSNNHKSVFTDEDVMTIRNRYVNESGKEIYEDYKNRCSYTTLERILLGKTYDYLPIYKKKLKQWQK